MLLFNHTKSSGGKDQTQPASQNFIETPCKVVFFENLAINLYLYNLRNTFKGRFGNWAVILLAIL